MAVCPRPRRTATMPVRGRRRRRPAARSAPVRRQTTAARLWRWAPDRPMPPVKVSGRGAGPPWSLRGVVGVAASTVTRGAGVCRITAGERLGETCRGRIRHGLRGGDGSPTGMNIHRNTYAMTPAPNARAAAANASRTSHTGAPRCRLTPRHTPTRTRPFRGRINGRLGVADGGWARRACHCVRRGACGCRYGLFGWVMVPLCASGKTTWGITPRFREQSGVPRCVRRPVAAVMEA